MYISKLISRALTGPRSPKRPARHIALVASSRAVPGCAEILAHPFAASLRGLAEHSQDETFESDSPHAPQPDNRMDLRRCMVALGSSACSMAPRPICGLVSGSGSHSGST